MLVYRYGALKPTHGFDDLQQQLRLANRYRNALIELHRWRRVAEADGVPRERTKILWSEGQRFLRKNSGLGWATYQLIEDDVKRAIKAERSVVWYTLDRVPRISGSSEVRFRRFDGTGRVAATIQACSDITTDLTQTEKCPLRLTAQSGLALAVVRIKDGMTVSLPVMLHRQLPREVHLVRAAIVIDRIGDRWVYSLNITMRHSHEPRQFGSGSAAINFGWRRVPGGVRVAYVSGAVDHELVIPDQMIAKLKHSESLRGLADGIAADYLGDSRKRTRARREALVGASNPELGKIQIEGEPVSAEHWARRDRHLYQWERDEYAKVLRQRREIYRLWVRGLAERYGSLSIEDFDMAKLVERGNDAIEIPSARHVRFLVAPGYLREEVESVFGDRCKRLKKAKRTAICNECGHECKFNRSRKLRHACEHCGAEWDQDANNTANQRLEVAA